MELNLAGKQAWILGASSGLGYAVAEAFAREGALVTVSARETPRLGEATARLSELGQVSAAPVDLTEPEQLVRTARHLMKEGGIDIVVMSGGGPPPSTLATLDGKSFDEAFALLLRPAFTVLKAVTPHMRERKRGVVCFLTSSGVKEPIDGLLTSNVMRAGVTALAKTAANELGSDGIRVFCAAPGRIATERVAALDEAKAKRENLSVTTVTQQSQASIPLGRYGTPEEFGQVVAFLCSPVAHYLSGVTVSIDGGKGKGL